jgi:hypothetical protein
MQTGLHHDPPNYTSNIAGMTDKWYHAQLLLIEMGAHKLLAQTGLETQTS